MSIMTTTEQLIAELEKPRKNYPQGVLTWEVGDVAVKGDEQGIVEGVSEVTSRSLPNINGMILIRLPYTEYTWTKASDCTHSADDPRLLGRVLRELGEDENVDIYIGSRERYPADYNLFLLDIDEHFEGDTLLHAALKALLAKVEGE